MKRFILNISPYLLLLVPVFIALGVLLFYSDPAVNEETVINASFIKIPNFNLIKAICSIF